VTAAIATEDCRYLFTASKDGSIARWDISSFSSSSSSSSTSTSTSTLTNGSSSGQPEASTSTSTPPPKITKLDFIPKRVLPKRRTKADSKGKAVIARNQPSQDLDTPGHTDEIFTLAISGDGTRLASGGKDRRIGVWDISSQLPSQGCRWLSGLRGHKDTIASLRFRLGTSQLYTSSFDRTVKIYDIASLAYIETLFGHQDKIQDVAVLKNELAVTAGGRDKTLRYWKIKDETQLVFRAGGTSKIRSVLEGGLEDVDIEEADADEEKKKKLTTTREKKFVEGSVDCTTMIDDTHFISGGDSG
jgi:ribosomal RNA-processing protein 9